MGDFLQEAFVRGFQKRAEPNLDLATNTVKKFEGFKPGVYKDVVGIPTSGYGFTGKLMPKGPVTEQSATAHLKNILKEKNDKLMRVVKQPITENERAALLSLQYNIGDNGIAKSTVVNKLNAGDRAGAANAFDMWNQAKGKVIPGLAKRRTAEKKLFTTPAPPLVTSPVVTQPGLVGKPEPIVPTPTLRPEPTPEMNVSNLPDYVPPMFKSSFERGFQKRADEFDPTRKFNEIMNTKRQYMPGFREAAAKAGFPFKSPKDVLSPGYGARAEEQMQEAAAWNKAHPGANTFDYSRWDKKNPVISLPARGESLGTPAKGAFVHATGSREDPMAALPAHANSELPNYGAEYQPIVETSFIGTPARNAELLDLKRRALNKVMRQPSPGEILARGHSPLDQSAAKTNLLSAQSALSPEGAEETLKHEAGRHALQSIDTMKSRLNGETVIPAVNDKQRYTFSPQEIDPRLGALQESAFKQTGSRVKTPEQLQEIMKLMDFKGGGKDATMPIPGDTMDLINEYPKLSPENQQLLQQKMMERLPGLVQNQSNTANT